MVRTETFIISFALNALFSYINVSALMYIIFFSLIGNFLLRVTDPWGSCQERDAKETVVK